MILDHIQLHSVLIPLLLLPLIIFVNGDSGGASMTLIASVKNETALLYNLP